MGKGKKARSRQKNKKHMSELGHKTTRRKAEPTVKVPVTVKGKSYNKYMRSI